MLWFKIKLFLRNHWLGLTIAAVTCLAVLFPVWYLAGIEENTRRYIISMNVASMPWMVLNTIIFVGFLYLMQSGGFSALKKTRIDAGLVNIKFADVVGLGEAKREAWEVVQLIKDRTRVKAIGGKILKGVLLVGPPGCGKTMLAKAVATEAGVPFISISGSEFVEVFVGVGASRVRKLFKQAKEYAQAHGSCIIFIDEIEVIGRKRVLYDAFGGGSETNSTQNQLLVEMDGLESEANIVVFAATNAIENILDDALLRPGRFDRKIFVGRPNLEEREALFAYYLGKVKYAPDLEVARLARKAVHKTPAEVENIVKEAALIAARNGRDQVTFKDFSEAIERVELGVAHRLSLNPREREMTAYHEAGHLLALYLTHPTSDVFKVSILNRGGALGVVHSAPTEEIYAADRDTLLAHVRTSLGGYAAEKIKYGVTTEGVRSDFAKATTIAHDMVWRLGMGKSGFIGDFTAIPQHERSGGMSDELNREAQGILKDEYAAVDALLRDNWQVVERFVVELLAREELDYDEIAGIFSEYGKPPRPLKSAPAAPTLPAA
ncbi:MAG: cell division protein FtsH [Elusimicrobia bacterium HGW-Elusimicrobia-3]|nr:MAG: cell division protein FtsH [Elusimicrobia bacterium HGW-Elusimicrobia-3]